MKDIIKSYHLKTIQDKITEDWKNRKNIGKNRYAIASELQNEFYCYNLQRDYYRESLKCSSLTGKPIIETEEDAEAFKLANADTLLINRHTGVFYFVNLKEFLLEELNPLKFNFNDIKDIKTYFDYINPLISSIDEVEEFKNEFLKTIEITPSPLYDQLKETISKGVNNAEV